MPVNWLDNCPDDMRRSHLPNNVQSILEMERIPNLAPSENLYHITNGLSVPGQSKSMHLKPDEQVMILFYQYSFPKDFSIL
jgi:hypothetical protein